MCCLLKTCALYEFDLYLSEEHLSGGRDSAKSRRKMGIKLGQL